MLGGEIKVASTLGLGSVTFTIPLDIDQTAKVIQPKSKIGCQEFWKRNCFNCRG
jgi:hypothetical protein